MLLVPASISARRTSARSGALSTLRTWPGRPFLPRIGTSQASSAPARSSRCSTSGHNRGSRSSTLVSSSSVVLVGSAGPGGLLAEHHPGDVGPARRVAGAGAHPDAATRSAGRSSLRSASVTTSAMPVGVVSSPWPPALTGQPRASSATAGTGTGRTPWAVRTVPAPRATGPALRVSTSRSCRAAAHADHVGDRVQRADLVEVHLVRARCRAPGPPPRPAGRTRRARGRVRGRAGRRSSIRSRTVAQRRCGWSAVATVDLGLGGPQAGPGHRGGA